MTTRTYEYELTRFGVQLGYDTKHIIRELLHLGMAEDDARDLLAKVRERYLSPDENL